jgi:hypothetical protein
LGNSCTTKTEIVLVGEARVVQKLENGNFEVTPATILEIARLKGENNMLQLEVKKLHELIEILKKSGGFYWLQLNQQP